MHTLGSTFTPPGFHAGGLRYHGMAPLVSHLKQLDLIEATAYTQNECFAAGVLFGGWHWLRSLSTGAPATSGTVMLAALPLIIGIQFIIAFLHHDVEHVPTEPLSNDLAELDDDRFSPPKA